MFNGLHRENSFCSTYSKVERECRFGGFWFLSQAHAGKKTHVASCKGKAEGEGLQQLPQAAAVSTEAEAKAGQRR